MTEIPRLYWPYEGIDRADLGDALRSILITQKFGENPSWYLPYGYPGHNGLDLFGKSTKFITPVWWGTVISKAYDTTGYGYHLIIDHEGLFNCYYGHASALHVKSGDRVTPHTIIMTEDNTGNSTGSHLHLGTRYKQQTGVYKGFFDPLPALISGIPDDSVPPSVSPPEENGDFEVFPATGIAFATPYLNIRLLPTSKSLDIGNIMPNERVEVLGLEHGTDGLDWYKITFRAYAWAKYIRPE